MKWKICLLLSMFSLFGTELEKRVNSLEEQMKEVGTETPNQRFGAKFAPTEFKRGWIGIEFFGSLLYWQAKVGGTEYVYSLSRQALGLGEGAVESQSFDWDFGYRFGGGICLPIINWTILGIYTHFGTKDSVGRGVIPPSLLINLKGGVMVSSKDVKSFYKIGYDSTTLVLRKNSFLGSLFGVGSSLGIKKAWIGQRQTASYSISGKDLLKVKERCYFQGVGPLIGVHTKWHLFSGWSLLGEVAGALLFGNFEVKHLENQIDLKGNAHLFSPNLLFFLGVSKDVPLNCMQVSFALGYEAEYYWRQNQAVEIENAIGRGNQFRFQLIRYADDLTFYGIRLRAAIEF